MGSTPSLRRLALMRHDRATANELPEIEVWMVADAACGLAEGRGPQVLHGVPVVLDAWAESTQSAVSGKVPHPHRR